MSWTYETRPHGDVPYACRVTLVDAMIYWTAESLEDGEPDEPGCAQPLADFATAGPPETPMCAAAPAEVLDALCAGGRHLGHTAAEWTCWAQFPAEWCATHRRHLARWLTEALRRAYTDMNGRIAVTRRAAPTTWTAAMYRCCRWPRRRPGPGRPAGRCSTSSTTRAVPRRRPDRSPPASVRSPRWPTRKTPRTRTRSRRRHGPGHRRDQREAATQEDISGWSTRGD